MAIVNHTVVEHPFTKEVKIFKWVLTSGDTGDVVFIPNLQGDKSFMVVGNFAISDCALQGSLSPDEATMVQLKNLQGDPLLFTADDVESVAPACYAYRPVAGAVTSVTVYLFCR